MQQGGEQSLGKKVRKKVSESFAGSENSSTFATANGKTPLRMALNGLRRVRLSKKNREKICTVQILVVPLQRFWLEKKIGRQTEAAATREWREIIEIFAKCNKEDFDKMQEKQGNKGPSLSSRFRTTG